MARATYYAFKFRNGDYKMLTLHDAVKIPELKERVNQIIESFKSKRMKHDGFQPGFMPNINEYVGGRKEYAKKLKEKGLVEIGYDYIPKESKPDISPLAGQEMAEAIKEIVPELSDREVDAMATGEYFKNKPIDGLADD